MLSISRLRKKSIKNKLLIDIGGILIGMCVISYLVICYIFIDIIQGNEKEKADIMTNAAITQTRVMIDTMEDVMDNMAMMTVLQGEDVSIEERMTAVKISMPIKCEIALFDCDGEGVTSTGKKINVADSHRFRQAMKDTADVFDIITYNQQSFVMIVRPVKDEQDEIRMIILAYRKVEEFFDRIMQVSGGELCYMANNSGDVFWRNAKEIGKSQVGSMSDVESTSKLFDRPLVKEQQYEMRAQDTLTKRSVLLNYSLLGRSNWVIGTARQEKKLIDELARFGTLIFLGMIVVIAIAMLIVYMIASSIVKRIDGIASHLDNTIKSEFREKLPLELLQNDDEIGKIAKQVKHLEDEVEEMLDSIKSSIDYLNDMQ